MRALAIITDHLEPPGAVMRQLTALFDVRLLCRADLTAAPSGQHAFVDIDLADVSRFAELNRWVHQLPEDRTVVFAVDAGARRQTTQAFALGATHVIARPVEGRILLGKLLGDVGSLIGDSGLAAAEQARGVQAGIQALQSIFVSAGLGNSLDRTRLAEASTNIVSELENGRLADWIAIVRMHHSQTYQHCLLVTGVIVAFACHFGFSRADRSKLALAGLLHDVGKAQTPLAILEKPGPLDANELAIMRQHPELGFAALQSAGGMEADILDLVLHHHEYLDGSGYPHGLGGSDLPDLTRIMTISDIFAALLERRSYKEPLSGPAAYKVLQKMGPKLDPDITRAFAAIAQMHA
jgi:putative nucleotidyltransferase with HDIG domain